tara:strand:+ start:8553 stop:8780 length:228 start_codon:yes stop_codon:yes gene_type:complete
MKDFIDKSLRYSHKDIHQELDAMKVRAQVKSRWYYIFWGVATVSVVAGQIYVGSGYRDMSKQLLEMTNAYLSRNQ